MSDVLKIAARNLARYRRRTLLTALLITIGIMAVLLFVAITGSFKSFMIGQITDSMLGHLQVHRRGYTASVENLPLNLNLQPPAIAKVEGTLKGLPEVADWSVRVKLGAMFSNFQETTSIRLNGVNPEAEDRTAPGLRGRIVEGRKDGSLVAPGEVMIPELLARGMKVKVGDTVVLVTTNQDGSVNGKTFTVRAVLEPVTGPGGRDGYINIADARELLRMEQPQAMEIAIRLKNPSSIDAVQAALQGAFGDMKTKQGQPALEIHTWEGLTPFANIARMIDIMTVSIKVMLVAIVLVSVMNVMLMAVYERIREIGTIAAIGTPPRKILWLFVSEGLLLGLVGTTVGTALSLGVVYALNVIKLTFNFGRQQIVLAPTVAPLDVIVVVLMVLAIAVLASLQPAWKASRMDPNTALRHV